MIRVVCPNCNSQFDAQDAYAGRAANCPQCGSQLTIPAATQAPPAPGGAPVGPGGFDPQKGPGVGLAGFICGIVGFSLSLMTMIPCIGCFTIFLAGPTALAGLICSIIGMVQAKKRGQKQTQSLVGLILSVLAMVWVPLAYFLILASAGAAMDDAIRNMPPPRRF